MPLITNTIEEYHASKGFSKSQLWAYATKTPYMAKNGKRKETNAFDVGHAAHTAILEPHLLATTVVQGPDAHGSTTIWKDAAKKAKADNLTILKPSDYNLVMELAKMADKVPELIAMRDGALIEQSCYATDEETGATLRCRPDIYSPSLGLMADIKNMADISDDAWSRDLGKFGYHMQDAMYRDVWNNGSDGMEAEAFFFICFSKTEPPEVICRELEPVDVDEGFHAYRSSLKLAVECDANQHWPGQPTGVVRGVKMRDRDRRFTEPQWKIDREAAASEGDEYAE